MNTKSNPQKKIALVAGGTTGMGFAIARKFVSHRIKQLFLAAMNKSLPPLKRNSVISTFRCDWMVPTRLGFVKLTFSNSHMKFKFTLIICTLACLFANAQLKLPRLVSDGMVLQRNVKTKVWGWAAPNEKIGLHFKNKDYQTTADKNGAWHFILSKQDAGGPYEMSFTASNQITIRNILFGDVWLCSGQSNMELTMERVQDKYPDAIATSNNKNIRQFLVPDKYNFEKPNEDFEAGEWLEADRDHILKFSAVAYFFAREVYEKYKVPVGLINSALGGSPAEAWISEGSLKIFPDKYNELQLWKDKNRIAKVEADDRAVSYRWYHQLNANDIGQKERWSKNEVDLNTWADTAIPGYWRNPPLLNLHGAVWFKKEVVVPKSMIGKPVKLLLGRIVDADSVFINGSFVGTTSYQYPPRRYFLKPEILKEGSNTITIRVICNSGTGGFVPDKPYFLTAGNDSIDLKGLWKYKIGSVCDALPSSTFIRLKPAGLFNAMIAPLANFPMKGALWYQGESNTKNPSEYPSLMFTLIKDWRSLWKRADLPFLLVQLPNFMERKGEPSESSWAELRQAQLEISSVANTALVVAIDAGEWNDIHPLDKKTVGHRLALQAMRKVYGEKNLISSGPMIKSGRREGNKIILSFTETGSGLCSRDGKELSYFSVAASDRKFFWAKAQIINQKEVAVWSNSVDIPTSVRYAWADNPEGANLANKEMLPASPFLVSGLK